MKEPTPFMQGILDEMDKSNAALERMVNCDLFTYGEVAQLVEREVEGLGVVGSIPTLPPNQCSTCPAPATIRCVMFAPCPNVAPDGWVYLCDECGWHYSCEWDLAEGQYLEVLK